MERNAAARPVPADRPSFHDGATGAPPVDEDVVPGVLLDLEVLAGDVDDLTESTRERSLIGGTVEPRRSTPRHG